MTDAPRKTIPALSTYYAGRNFRSRVEARWALWFDAVGLKWHYEWQGLATSRGGYLPDFFIPEWNMFLEVKGQEPTELELQKCRDVSETTECDILIVAGPPEERFQLRWFSRGLEMGGLFVIARDVWTMKGFWLIGEEDENSRWIGPNKSTLDSSPRGPMFDGALSFAYEAALSADFPKMKRGHRQAEIAEGDVIRLTESRRNRTAA